MSTDRQPIHPIKTDPPDIVTGRKLPIIDMLLMEIERRLVLDDCERADLERVKEILEGMDNE